MNTPYSKNNETIPFAIIALNRDEIVCRRRRRIFETLVGLRPPAVSKIREKQVNEIAVQLFNIIISVCLINSSLLLYLYSDHEQAMLPLEVFAISMYTFLRIKNKKWARRHVLPGKVE